MRKLFPVLTCIYAVCALSTPPTAAQDEVCVEPIGRIIEGDSSNFRRGQTICSGQEIVAPEDVNFLCFTNRSIVDITDDVVVSADLCQSAAATGPVRRCDATGIRRILCFIPKGPEDQFQIIRPEAVASDPRPQISWEAVPNSEAYTVYLEGPDLSWQRSVDANTTELAYPSEESALTSDNAYEVLVTAQVGEEVLVTSRVVNISEKQVQNIQLQFVASTNGAQ